MMTIGIIIIVIFVIIVIVIVITIIIISILSPVYSWLGKCVRTTFDGELRPFIIWIHIGFPTFG